MGLCAAMMRLESKSWLSDIRAAAKSLAVVSDVFVIISHYLNAELCLTAFMFTPSHPKIKNIYFIIKNY